jgi:hypothetical protein
MLEAMQEGIPVIASDIPPHQQLIGEGRGMLFETGDVDSCVRCLDWAIHHPAEMLVKARNAQMHVHANYNWNHITTETLKLYTTLCNSPVTFSTKMQGSTRHSLAVDAINYTNVKPLCSCLLDAGLLTQEHINDALAEQKITGMRLEEILEQQGLVKKQTIQYLIER